ncbi:CRISPR-associated helicase Cas3' [Halanaerobacter jeridensis]|uniref:CRISPR-associated endonuclease/helicase Cas3 n=1 Tax=Halanaerobacter jeridensis TaxID=706427 RepID=A0A939BQA6_9FIRM|nr:CRISPR-associated helicase Cas3' [Halanaerobacter jeridensis]MBM7556089.1 CRISPR-associated endonuclease/helicase Cas3 [Halanaerobacter jeridensis]
MTNNKLEAKINDYYGQTKSGQEIDGFSPFKYQKEVAQTILNGENLILQAPTGAGKTLASIMPFVIGNEEKIDFPKKLIYSTPRRTLVNSLYTDIYDEINQGNFDKEFDVTLQTGEKKEDRYFSGDIIFTTFDQSLSSALSMPISLSKRLGNVNLGAVFSSYLIFDEFHLFDLSSSYTTTTLLLEKLKDKIPFCIMTATISRERIQYLADKLDAKIIRADKPEYLKDIVTQQGKERKIFIRNNSLQAKKIINLHNQIENTDADQSKKSIVMCNRVENAKKIYDDIKELLEKNNEETDIMLIHSRFLDKDRNMKERKIKKMFSKDNKQSDVILISTQVIEVGIDITSDIMHTEISSIDSFLQRIGRCARYRNQKGQVYVYDVLNEGDKKYLPYDRDVTVKTFEALEKIDGQVLNPELSQEIINEVYSEETNVDALANEKIDNSTDDFILKSWKNPDKSQFKDLIRHVIACSVVIKKWIVDKMSPYNYQSLSISPWTLRKKLKEIDNDTDDWLVKEVIERDDDSDFKYTYRAVDINNIYPNNLYILNPDYFSYNKEKGLQFEEKNKEIEFDLLPYSAREFDYDEQYNEESYLQHICRIKDEVRDLEIEMNYLINFLKEKFNLNDGDFRNIIEFTIWSHDLGKLQDEWQLAHKKSKYEFIAHAERNNKPPSHAAESFWVCLSLLEDFVLDYLNKDGILIDIIGKSIISHHSINLTRVDKYNISKVAKNYLLNINAKFFTEDSLINFINEGIDRLYLNSRASEDISDEIRLKTIEHYLFYFSLVRILRLADQRATKKLNQFEEEVI